MFNFFTESELNNLSPLFYIHNLFLKISGIFPKQIYVVFDFKFPGLLCWPEKQFQYSLIDKY